MTDHPGADDASSGEDEAEEGRPDLIARLLDDPSHVRALDYAARYLNTMFDRPREVLGTNVGVTALPGGSARVLIRINGGWQATTEVTRDDQNLVVRIYLSTYDDDPDLEAIRVALDGKRVEGFKRVIQNVGIEVVGLDRGLALLEDPTAAQRAREFMEDVSRRLLPQPNWHNPALNDLLDPLLKP